MKKIVRVLLTGVALLVSGYLIYGYWARIEAKVWHWRHGYSLYVGDYQIPVPDHWLVLDTESESMATLVNTHVKRAQDPFSRTSVITVSYTASPPRDLDAWASLSRQMIEREGVSDVEGKTLRAGDETIVCLGGLELRALVHVPSLSAVSLECRSSGRLSLGFSGPESGLTEFYSIASQIQERK